MQFYVEVWPEFAQVVLRREFFVAPCGVGGCHAWGEFAQEFFVGDVALVIPLYFVDFYLGYAAFCGEVEHGAQFKERVYTAFVKVDAGSELVRSLCCEVFE